MNRQIVLFKLFLITSMLIGCAMQKEVTQSIEKKEIDLIPALVINGIDHQSLTIEEGMKKYKVPGMSIAFFDKGKIQWTQTYGTISDNNPQLVNPQTLFQAASISKPVTALGLMKLVAEGKVELDNNVNNYFDGWQLQDEANQVSESVTIRHLLSHTGGISVAGYEGYNRNASIPSLQQILNGEAPANSKKVLQAQIAGEKWNYSSGGYTILQKLMEDIQGAPFENYLQNAVLNPIGMKKSSFKQNLSTAQKGNVAYGHDGQGNTIEGNWRIYPEQAAAGLWTTPTDLALFAIHLQKAFASKEQNAMKSMFTNQLGGWGLGVDLSNKDHVLRFMHGGANEGFRCHLVAEANLGQGVVIMTNGVGGEALIQDLLRGISKAYDWSIYKAREKNMIALSPTHKEKFVGKYFMVGNEQVVVEISKTKKGLKVVQTWNGQSYQILPANSLHFFRETDGIPVDFKESAEGEVIELLAGGEMLFKKVG